MASRLLSFCLVFFFIGISFADDGSIIQTENGQIQCSIYHDHRHPNEQIARSCLGVPFAAPPIGDLRFTSPQPPQSWSGVRNATKYSPACMQNPSGLAWTKGGPEPLDEDCLYLNVYTPPVTVTPPAGGFPVMVFLYGGCWEYGSAAFPVYDGDYMESYSDTIVMVTVNYRLGAFGFLASQALKEDSVDGSAGNYGVQDQRFALQWVQRNIANFGGNKDKVMIFGQSAGSGSVGFHVASERSAGLFHSAVMESGPYAGWSSLNMTVQQRHFDIMTQKTSCNTGSNADQLACLRSLTADQVLHNSGGIDIGNGCTWAPTVDGVELVIATQHQIQTGKFNRVPVMLGTNTDEGSTFVLPCDANDQEYWAYMNETAGPDLGTLIYYRYPSSDYKSPFWAASAVMTDACMACPARRTARWLSGPIPEAGDGINVYLYHFEHQPDVSEVDRCLGVFHGAELPFVFYDKPILDVREMGLAKEMVNWWQSMATYGTPNGPEAPFTWPTYDVLSDQSAYLSLKSGVEKNLKKDNCDWWDAYSTANVFLC